MRLSLAEVAQATGGALSGPAGAEVASYHSDSREVSPGGLFFALSGSTSDGHRFVPDAVERGAAAVVVDREVEAGQTSVLRVTDTWAALYDLARQVLARVSPLVVGVPGSNGKTSTKEFAAAALSPRFRTWKTHGHLNTDAEVPLTILQLEPEHQAL